MTGDRLLEGARLLITGGTQGLGAAIARRALSEGAAGLVLVGRSEERGERTAEELRLESSRRRVTVKTGTDAGEKVLAGDAVGHAHQAQVVFLRADLALIEDRGRVVNAAVEVLGGLDGVVNAAGLTTRGTMLTTSEELLDEHLSVNLKAPFRIMGEFIRHRKDQGGGGSCVNIITMSAHGGQPFLAPYVASKSGLAGATKNAAYAHRADRIRINGLNIGWTATEGEDKIQRRFHGADDSWRETAAARAPLGRIGDPDEIARMVCFLLSEASGVVTGAVLDWDQVVIGAWD